MFKTMNKAGVDMFYANNIIANEDWSPVCTVYAAVTYSITGGPTSCPICTEYKESLIVTEVLYTSRCTAKVHRLR